MTYDQLIADGHKLTEYLKERFNKEKIYLLGHSWGAQLGLELVDRYPEDYYSYIGVSQVVDNKFQNMIAYPWLLEQIKAKGAEKDLYGNIRSDSNALSEYINQYPPGNKEDEELLRAMKRSDVALYEIADSDQENGIIMLRDIMNNSEPIKLIDIGMSENLNPNIFLFTRLIHLDEFSMTSGLTFAFSIDHKDYLIIKSHKMMKKVTGFDESVARFVTFFMLNRLSGLPVLLEKVK